MANERAEFLTHREQWLTERQELKAVVDDLRAQIEAGASIETGLDALSARLDQSIETAQGTIRAEDATPTE
jgi:hypothetical protein